MSPSLNATLNDFVITDVVFHSFGFAVLGSILALETTTLWLNRKVFDPRAKADSRMQLWLLGITFLDLMALVCGMVMVELEFTSETQELCNALSIVMAIFYL